MVSFYQYADDTQLYIGANSSTLLSQVASIESCTLRVHDWLLNNGLHLNLSKSEAIAFFNPRSKPIQTLAESIGSISVSGSPIKLQTTIKNLGVYLDSRLSFDKQVSEICKASYFHIRALRHIRSSLTTEAAKTIASAIVGSRLDYCNSLLAGTSVSNLARLIRTRATRRTDLIRTRATRRMDGRTDGRKDGRTDEIVSITILHNSPRATNGLLTDLVGREFRI